VVNHLVLDDRADAFGHADHSDFAGQSTRIDLRGGAGGMAYAIDMVRVGRRTQLYLVTKKATSGATHYDHWSSACRPDNRNCDRRHKTILSLEFRVSAG